ncbi:hypothetical protein ACV34N_31340, partial [Pseudomonas aeruginosa]
GKNLAKADPQHAGELLQLLAAGKSQLFNENDDLKVLQPLQPIPGAKPWGVLLEVPKSALLGPALALERQLDDMRREGTWVELGLGLGAAGGQPQHQQAEHRGAEAEAQFDPGAFATHVVQLPLQRQGRA